MSKFSRELGEEREAKQNSQFTPWQRFSTWGKLKYIGELIFWFIGILFLPTALSYKYLIFGGLIAKIIAIPFVVFFTYAYCFFIDCERNRLRKLSGKHQIEFKDDLNDLPHRSLVKKS